MGPEPTVETLGIATGGFSSPPSGPGQAARVAADQQQALRRTFRGEVGLRDRAAHVYLRL